MIIVVSIMAFCLIAIMVDIYGIRKALEKNADKMKGGK